jgi:very-short-patch-repair endonuclease
MDNKERNRRLTERASRQHGLISREQALRLEFSRSGIHRRVQSGQWRAIRPGVYRVGPVASSWHQELMGACLWIGPEAVASHTSAAGLLKLDGVPFPGIEVTTSKSRNPERTGVMVHRSQSLPTEDKTVIEGIPCTRAARTIIDLASALEEHQLELALEDALRRRLVNVPWLYRRLRALGTTGRRGSRSLARFLSLRKSGEALTDSALEARVFQTLRKAGLPRPERQFMITTKEEFIAQVDFAYPKQRLIIEADGYRYHQDLQTWTHDRDRLSKLAADGWRVMHARWKDVAVGQDDFVKRVQKALQPSMAGRRR